MFELSTRLSSFNRKDGASATAKAAYRAGCEIVCEKEGRTHDYRRKTGVEMAEIVLPAGAPEWARERGKLWNAAEFVERNKDPRAKSVWKENVVVAREWFFSLPYELSKEGREAAARAVALHLVGEHGVAVDFAIHQPGKEGDSRNWHVHMLITSRRMTDVGLGDKATEFNENLKKGSDLTKNLRKTTAGIVNKRLKAEGRIPRVEWRSFKDRGVGQRPTKHQGPSKTNVKRKQLRSERETWAETKTAEQKDKQDKEAADLKIRQEFEKQRKMAERQQRYREFVAKIRGELRGANEADRLPTGLKRAFLIATGLIRKVGAERLERIKERTREARQRIETMRKALNMEARTFEGKQQRDRQQLQQRHEAENQQLKKAMETKADIDKIRERQDRRAEVTQNRGREQGRERTLEFG